MKKLQLELDGRFDEVGKLLDETCTDLGLKFKRFFNATTNGLEKFLSSPNHNNKK